MSTSLSSLSSSLDMISPTSPPSTRWASDSLSDDEDEIVWSLSSSIVLSSSSLSETASDYVLVPRITDPTTPTPPAPPPAGAGAAGGGGNGSSSSTANGASGGISGGLERDTRTSRSSESDVIVDGMAALSLSGTSVTAAADICDSNTATGRTTTKRKGKKRSKNAAKRAAGDHAIRSSSNTPSPSPSSLSSSSKVSSSISSPSSPTTSPTTTTASSSSISSARPGGPEKARSHSESNSAEVTTPKQKLKKRPKKKKKSGASSGSGSLSAHPASARPTPPRGSATADVPNTTKVNAKAEACDDKNPSSTTINTGYHEAHKFMSSYLAHPPPPGNNGSALLMLQALILELGCLPSAAAGKFSIPELPGTMRQAKLLLKSRAFINVRDYLAVREQGQAALRGVMHSSRKSLVREVRKGKRVPVQEVKKAGLNILLVNTRI